MAQNSRFETNNPSTAINLIQRFGPFSTSAPSSRKLSSANLFGASLELNNANDFAVPGAHLMWTGEDASQAPHPEVPERPFGWAKSLPTAHGKRISITQKQAVSLVPGTTFFFLSL